MVPYSNGELAQMEQAGKNAERCVCCGAIIPEGRQVCLICELNVKNKCNLVEVKRGKWIVRNNPMYSPFDGSDENVYICNQCGVEAERATNYCQNCGAEMDGGKDNGNS